MRLQKDSLLKFTGAQPICLAARMNSIELNRWRKNPLNVPNERVEGRGTHGPPLPSTQKQGDRARPKPNKEGRPPNQCGSASNPKRKSSHKAAVNSMAPPACRSTSQPVRWPSSEACKSYQHDCRFRRSPQLSLFRSLSLPLSLPLSLSLDSRSAKGQSWPCSS